MTTPPTEPTNEQGELLPCPFCGGIPESVTEAIGDYTWKWFECQNEGCYIQPYSPQDLDRQDALRHWNRRVTPAAPSQTYDEWWDANYADTNAAGIDRTFGEEVWNAAREIK